jgi:tetratricopeptide (TPR) repeat protein
MARGQGGRADLRALAGWLVVAVLGFGVFLMQRAYDHNWRRRESMTAEDELLYFPSGKLLAAAAGEYRLLVADYAWLEVAQYSGSHMGLPHQEENYRWLGNAMDIIGELDPHFISPYVFGAQMLAWDAVHPDDGLALLRKGCESNPMSWELPFQAGFIAYQVMKDYNLAGYYFAIAAQLPGVWSVAPRMAAAAYSKGGDFELTRELWNNVYQNQPNPKVKDLARRQLLALLRQELTAQQAAADSFGVRVGRPPASLDELVARHYLEQIPQEPFGGQYSLRSGRVLDNYVEFVRAIIPRLQQAVYQYRALRHTFPGGLDDLLHAGLLKQIPPEPFGGQFLIENGIVGTTSPLP